MDESVGSNTSAKDVANYCVRCKQPIKIGIKCNRCGRLAHKACAKLLKNALLLDGERMICCGDFSTKMSERVIDVEGVTEEEITTSGEFYRMKIKYMEEIIKQKDLIIMNQGIAITALTDQNELLKRQILDLSDNISQSTQKNVVSHAKLSKVSKPVKRSTTINTTSTVTAPEISIASRQEEAPGHTVTIQDVSKAIHNIEARRICDDIVNVESDIITERRNQTRNSRSVLVGCGNDQKSCPFKAASLVKFKEFHATNFEVNVDEVELCSYLKGFVPDIQVKKLVSRNPNRYSSFKISVPYAEVDKILVPEIWPNEVILNRFFRSKQSFDGYQRSSRQQQN